MIKLYMIYCILTYNNMFEIICIYDFPIFNIFAHNIKIIPKRNVFYKD